MASRSLNRVILIGNLTRDPELKYTPAGTAVCSFGVATNRSWKTAEGETKEETQYHRIVAWQKLAELCGKLLNKGKKVYVEGRIVYRTFTGRDGQQRTITEIVLDDFIVFGSGKKTLSGEENTQEETKPESPDIAPETAVTKNQEIKTETQADHPENETKKEESKNESEDVNPDDIPF